MIELDAQAVMDLKFKLLTEAGAKAAAGSAKPLSPRTVAKTLIPAGTVFRLAITTGVRSGEIRGRVDSIDLEGKRLFVEHQAIRRRADDGTKTENSIRSVPVPGYLIPELKRWKLACPPTASGLVFPELAGLSDVETRGKPVAPWDVRNRS